LGIVEPKPQIERVVGETFEVYGARKIKACLCEMPWRQRDCCSPLETVDD
jgi:hypothetical protein